MLDTAALRLRAQAKTLLGLHAPLAAAFLLLGGSDAQSQDGVVAGTVVSAQGLRPITGAQVVVAGTEISTLTDGRGRFRIEGLTGTQVTLRAAMLGYRTADHVARVGDLAVRIALEETAIELDAIVATGTPAAAGQRRSLGNAVDDLDIDRMIKVAPVPDMVGLLNAKSAGVSFQPSSGNVGAGSKIRIRGITSLSLGNEPLIYVDGIRLDNEARTGPSFEGRSYVSRLNDIDPNTIERIEVIKGPAAATLYGTEASNGVIHIITKRGVQGTPTVGVTVEQGANWIHDPEGRFPKAYYEEGGELRTFSFVEAESRRGTPVFRTGRRQRYAVDVTGGTGTLQYFASGAYERDEGTLPNNASRAYNARINLRAALRDNLDIALSGAWMSSNLHPGSTSGVVPAAYSPDPATRDDERRGGNYPPEAWYEVFSQWQDLTRFTGGTTITHRPFPWFEHRLNVGTDVVNEENVGLAERRSEDVARWFGSTGLGAKEVNIRKVRNATLDYSATATATPHPDLQSKTSIGAQYYEKRQGFAIARGDEFPAPGVKTISSAAVRTGGENFVDNTTVGIYLQQQVAWRNRLFLTAAVRADDNSAFGENFELVAYPKLSGAWVVSEEPFWTVDWMPALRLRAAYGQSGQQPSAFAAIRSYEAVTGPGGSPAVRPQFLGNPDLGPERGEEIELGFEAGLFDDRIAFDFTFYDKRTRDAILEKTVAPSHGFPGLQFVNVGEVRNTGAEFKVSAFALRRPRATWALDLTWSMNDNEIMDMGGVPVIEFAVRQQHREGFPVGALFSRRLVDVDLAPDGTLSNPMCDGGPENGHRPVPCSEAPRVYFGRVTPAWEGSLGSTLTLFDRITLYASADIRGGHHVYLADVPSLLCRLRRACRLNFRPEEDPLTAAQYEFDIRSDAFIRDATYAKLRQLSVTYLVPEPVVARFGMASASVTMSLRNLATWTRDDKFFDLAVDPEVGEMHPFAGDLYNQQQRQLPHPRQFVASMRFTF